MPMTIVQENLVPPAALINVIVNELTTVDTIVVKMERNTPTISLSLEFCVMSEPSEKNGIDIIV